MPGAPFFINQFNDLRGACVPAEASESASVLESALAAVLLDDLAEGSGFEVDITLDDQAPRVRGPPPFRRERNSPTRLRGP